MERSKPNELKFEHTSVYKCFAEDGHLIYVGIAYDVRERVREHRRSASWFSLVTEIKTESFPTRESAMMRETELIEGEKPIYNVAGNPDHRAKEWENVTFGDDLPLSAAALVPSETDHDKALNRLAEALARLLFDAWHAKQATLESKDAGAP